MDICALGVQDFAEEALLRHIEGIHFEEVIHAVFEHHAVTARALRGIDEVPDFVEGHCSRHLDSHMLAMLHGIEGHGGMGLPVGGDVDQVDIVAFYELAPYRVVTGIYVGPGSACGLEVSLYATHVGSVDVAQGHDLGAGYVCEAVHGTRSAHAQADKAHAHGVERFGGIGHHVFLAGRTGRYFCCDRPAQGSVVSRTTGDNTQQADEQGIINLVHDECYWWLIKIYGCCTCVQR